MTQLQDLSLVDTQITDAGLKHLEALTRLGHLYLHGSQVTDEGVEKLKQALPECKIYH